jgi:hypothetical protein
MGNVLQASKDVGIKSVIGRHKANKIKATHFKYKTWAKENGYY